MPHRSAFALLICACLVAAGCTADPAEDEGAESAESAESAAATSAPVAPELVQPAAGTTVVPGAGASELAIATSEALFASAPVVVLAPADDVGAQARAASIAVQLGVPMLLAETAAEAAGRASTSPSPSGSSTAGESATAGSGGASPDSAATGAMRAELERLGASTVLDVGGASESLALGDDVTVVAATGDADLSAVTGLDPGAQELVGAGDLVAAVAAIDPATPTMLTVADGPDTGTPSPDESTDESAGELAGGGALPALAAAPPLDDVLVLAFPDVKWLAAAATARAAGAQVEVVASGDPRSDPAIVAALAERQPGAVLGLGPAFGTPQSLAYRVDVAATGVELPGGGQVLFPGRRMVALYGNPTTSSLGVLGEQPLDEAIARAQRTAAEYDGLWGDEPVVPAFELITTVASAVAGPDGNYSTEMEIDELRPYVDAAREAGVYVVLDLQPGRTDFLTQAKIYEELLAEPHVGLALDPEWRLEPGEVHLVQIGSVSVDEVNAVVTWLADLTRERQLPQKLLILHQFRLDMIEGRERVDTSRDELAVLIHADGNGPPGSKHATYGALTAAPPPNIWWGWKNFYDEDSPTFTPAETAAVEPSPVFVSYQ